MSEFSPLRKEQAATLLASLFVLSACAILYELLISTVSSYLLGSSVLHFSITIGLFLSFLGVGAYLSKFLKAPLLPKFIAIELWLGLAGGFSALALFVGEAWFPNYYFLLGAVIALIATLAGLEIPIVTRLLEQSGSLRETIAKVLAFDYLGALAASLVFPLLLLPMMGNMRTAFFTGLINWGIGVFNLLVFRNNLSDKNKLGLLALGSGGLLLAGFVFSFRLVSFADALQFQDKVVLSQQTRYQRIVVTQWNNDLRLYLNGNLQFSSVDEYRYHEALVHLPMLAAARRDSVLLLGGGDGLALREIWKYPDVKGVVMVDLDEEMVNLARTQPLFTRLNGGSLDHPKLHRVTDDAFRFVKNNARRFNVILIDLPDPSDSALGKLYSSEFYKMVSKHLTPDGVMVTQSTSPFLARKPFWSIHQSVRTAFPVVIPYQVYVPSFGLWGFQMAFGARMTPAYAVARIRERLATLPSLRFLNADNVGSVFVFDSDTGPVDAPVNTLEKLEILQLYERSYLEFH